LLLVFNPRSSFSTVRFVNHMKKGGLFVLGHVVTGLLNEDGRMALERQTKAWQNLDSVAGVKAFVDCIVSRSVRDGVQSLLMTTGLGGMKPNIVLMGFFRETATVDELTSYRNNLAEKNRNTVFPNIKGLRQVDELMADFPPLEESRATQEKISAADYVGIIRDALTLKKNVGVTRNFSKLNRRMAYASSAQKTHDSQWYVDIWPIVPPFGETRLTYELLLQLGTIVHMVSEWEKRTMLRVVTIVDTQDEVQAEFDRIHAMCLDLRMIADVKVIAMELQPQEIYNAVITTPRIAPMAEWHAALNTLMKAYSDHTCVIFTYLPAPELDPDASENYIQCLDQLSAGLPPVVMMRGVQEVVTKGADAL